MPTQKKIDTVNKLTDKVTRAKAIVLTDYRGLKHKQFEEIRKALKKLEAELVVAKNRLMLRALHQSSGQTLGDRLDDLETLLIEPTATLFAFADEVAPIKELLKYFKTAGAGRAKGGLLGARFLSDTEVMRLAALPSREVLLGQLAGQLMAPVSGLQYSLSWNINKLVWALNKIKDQKLRKQQKLASCPF